ncbi:hypothetical protein BPOR_0772g00060 [Botrytis porri]|uniref:Uncharacterized protein n=1 Tax=Botrytis porri TaxID=87229 RepID=A0A4Z1KGR0_9HELO|nr:hypothetical protein BPOR_0772g00060 [Botrytis porri]
MEETPLHSSFVSIAFGMWDNEINFSTTPNRLSANSPTIDSAFTPPYQNQTLRSATSGVPGCTSPKICIR